ncbi:MAG: flavin reductase family protein [Mogibacterium sp.]|nr:flavin reductase family protein [Mogibacterium sp.]
MAKKYEKIKSKPGTTVYPAPPVMVSCGDMEKSNVFTAAWTGNMNSEPPMAYVSIRKERLSHEIISESGEFVLNLTNADLVKEMDFCGVKSGRELDKFEHLGLTKQQADVVKAPLIAEAPVNIECKVRDVYEYPSHDMFIADIVAVHIAKDFVCEDGAYDFAAMGLVALNHGKYYKLEEESRGFFGFSIMKPKTKARRMNQGKKVR